MPPSPLHLFYLDESGNTGADLDSAEQPIHWLVAVALSPAQAQGLERRLLALALRHFPERARDPDFEFHGAAIFRGEGDFAALKPAVRIALYAELLAELRAHDARLFYRGIDKAKHRDRARAGAYPPTHPHVLSFMFLAEALDAWLDAQQPAGDGPPVLGLVVADEQREVGADLVRGFARWRETATDYKHARQIRHLIDTVHYVPSHNSWLIQLADCVSFLLGRHHRTLLQKGADAAAYSRSEQAVRQLWDAHCLGCVLDGAVWPK